MDLTPWQYQSLPEDGWIITVNFHKVFKLQGFELEGTKVLDWKSRKGGPW